VQGKRLQYFNSISIQVVPKEVEEFPVDLGEPILFEGAQRASTIVEDGYEVQADEAPPVHEGLSDTSIVLINRSTSVRPWSHDSEGKPGAYIRTWNYTYIAASNEDLVAAMGQGLRTRLGKQLR